MDYVQNSLRGNISETANLSFDCIMCGLCASRCPAEIVQYNVGILCRRLYGRHIAPRAMHLEKRVAEIEAGKFDKELDEIMKTEEKTLKELYSKRDIEK